MRAILPIFGWLLYVYIWFGFYASLLNPQMAGGAFLAPFFDPIDPKKIDFSQISMTMPPILFWVLKMA